jgi:cytochrome c oxidase subunit 1
MAIVERPSTETDRLALEAGPSHASPDDALGVFQRPRGDTGWRSWLFTVDHKRIGIMYGAAALFFFLIGGIEALIIRTQLAAPEQEIVSADLYNQLFTMHGVTMIFLVVMPIGAAFANFLVPLQIGARDVAFPRLNAFSFWCFLFGGVFFNSSWFIGGGAADGGWFAYAPNTSVIFSPSHGMDFYAIGLQITGIASLVGAINLIATILNMRAPGMTLMKMPVFTWMSLVTQFLMLFAMPVISVALFLLTFDRLFDANFFDVSAGADPLLWEHLFWIFGHPEVYIMILPAFGIVSETIPVFSRKPIFGYEFIVFSGAAIGFMGWGVWAHHMFASGIGPISVAAFAVSTMFIAVPTGVKILNWMATMWGGKLSFTVPMLFSIGLVTMFTIGGLSGVSHAVAPSDTQQTDTYYIVAHFHYVLFGGALFGFVGGFYFWWPKAFGHMLREGLGKVHFWVMLLGFNLTFGPMHVLGLEGMPRRTHSYFDGYGFNVWNLLSTVGSFLIAVSFLIFFANIFLSRRDARKPGWIPPGPDPWDSRSLEWMTASPAPAHNFDHVPVVTHRDEFWYRKYGETDDHRVVRIATADDVAQTGARTDVHLPAPSYWPILLCASFPLIGWGLIFNLGIAFAGGALALFAIYGLAMEPADDPDGGHGHHDGDHGHGPDGGPDETATPTAGDADMEATLVE